MAEYITSLDANSPLFTYTPPVGSSLSTGWVETLIPAEVYYATSAPHAAVSFSFYGDQFELGGFLTPFSESDPGPEPCGFNLTVDGQLLTVLSYYQPQSLPLGGHNVNLDVFCGGPGQEMGFTGAGFVETQGTTLMQDEIVYLDASQIHTVGQWKKQEVFSDYYFMNFTQFSSTTPLSTLEYTFTGVKTEIVGTVGPSGSHYIVTLDGVPQAPLFPPLTAKNPVPGAAVVLWFAQELDNNMEHVVTMTNLGKNLTVLNVNYDVLLPASS